MRQPKVWISLLILTVIGLHALPILSYQGHRQNRWPILAWAMYAKSFPPGPIEALRKRIVTVAASGARSELSPHEVGVSRPTLGKSFTRPLWDGDTATARDLFRRLNRDRADPIVEFRLEGEKYSVSDTGVVKETFPPIIYRAESLPQR